MLCCDVLCDTISTPAYHATPWYEAVVVHAHASTHTCAHERMHARAPCSLNTNVSLLEMLMFTHVQREITKGGHREREKANYMCVYIYIYIYVSLSLYIYI